MLKERYFTEQSIESLSLEIAQFAQGQAHRKFLSFIPQQSALLVLDMQEYFLNPGSHAFIPSAPPIKDRINRLVDVYALQHRPIIFTQHLNTPKDAGMMSAWWNDLLTTQNPYHRLIPELDPAKGTLLKKSQYDAFYCTQMEEILRQVHVSQVVITGVMTHLCCETTARSAFMRGFQVFFLVDGTATYNLEFHRASILNLAHGFASVVLAKDILEAMRIEPAN